MKKITTTLVLMTFFLVSSLGQNAGNSLELSNGPVVFDHSGLSEDLGDIGFFTIEMWIKPEDVQTNQKLISKVSTNFKNGYILGIDKGQLDFEVFDDNGDKDQLKGGMLTAGVWQHVAVTYDQSSWTRIQKIYVNGELTASKESTLEDPKTNTNNLLIGAASWDGVSFKYKGEIDEIRFWSYDLTHNQIKEWMNKEAVQPAEKGVHPRATYLKLYLKCDETTGDYLLDSSPEENSAGDAGIRLRKTSTVPFKGGPAFVEGLRDIGGVWKGKSSHNLENFSIEGQSLTAGQSAIVERNLATQDFCNTPKADRIAKISCLRWHVVTQGSPNVQISYNLKDYNLFGFKDVVLLESDEVDDFSNAKIIDGSSAGAEISTETFTMSGNEKFYAIGFLTQGLGVDKLASSNSISLYPNPSTGKFTIEVKDAKLAPQSITVLDAAGQEVMSSDILSGSQSIDLSSKAKGVYFIRIATDNGNYTKRVTIF